jgi:hypothetical protein
VGDPELKNPETNGSFINRLIRGMVLLANKDKRELAYDSKSLVGLYNETICIYTGEVARQLFNQGLRMATAEKPKDALV